MSQCVVTSKQKCMSSIVSFDTGEAIVQRGINGGSLVSIVVQSDPTQAVDWSTSGSNTLDLASTSRTGSLFSF